MAAEHGHTSSRDRLCLALHPAPPAPSASFLSLPCCRAACPVGGALSSRAAAVYKFRHPVFCLCAVFSMLLSPVPLSPSHSQALTSPPHVSPAYPTCHSLRPKAQASAGQGSNCHPPSWSSLLLTLSSSSRQTTWGLWPQERWGRRAQADKEESGERSFGEGGRQARGSCSGPCARRAGWRRAGLGQFLGLELGSVWSSEPAFSVELL